MKTCNFRLGIGTGSGTLLSAVSFIGAHDMAKTIILAAIGAAVSFVVSWLLQQWQRHR